MDILLPLQIDNHLPRILYHTLLCMDEQLGLAGPRLLIVNRISYLFKNLKTIEDRFERCFINTAAKIGVTQV